MSTQAHGEIDAELEALGSVPAELRALVERYAGTDFRLLRMDELLSSLGSAGSAGALAMVAKEQAVVPSAEATAVGMDAPVGLSAALPWESERPAEFSEEVRAKDPSATLPAETHSEVGLSSSADLTHDDDEPVMTMEPAGEAADEESEPATEQKHDTVEDGPVVAVQLPAEPVLEVVAAPNEQANTATDVPSDARSPDEFEILVDDELLEISEDEVILDSDGEETT